jgi:NAD(P)-dependent dehydrogenase (short-subunit alcohol dehydrogenase family)
VPVDYVVEAMDHIAHKRGLDGHTFHLVDPDPPRIGEVLNTFCRAAHAPEMSMRLDARMLAIVPATVRAAVLNLPPVKRLTGILLKDLRIPPQTLKLLTYPTRFDSRETERALKGTKIAVPPLEDYAWRLWDFWERHLDPDLFVDHTLRGKVENRVVLITGGSSGIGRATAFKVAEAGAKVLIVARGEAELNQTRDEIVGAGGKCWAYPCDLADMASCDALVARVLAEHKHVDVLVNNAGRSIRRSIALSYDRFHDFERTMQLNYFGPVRLILSLLPIMRQVSPDGRKGGHIINVSSIGVQTNIPRFSAYVASKAALDAFSRCISSEIIDDGVHISTIYMPLVRTPMIAPTKMYDRFPTMSPTEAADMICKAMVRKPKSVGTTMGNAGALAYQLAPRGVDVVLNAGYKLFPDSHAARGGKDQKKDEPSTESVAFAHILRGVHW